ncbi:hypothetical protein N7522_001146 [Penicillium canescens]|nr:hypothetical protein N7522_001146 [Penicillium canescens]
MFLSGLTRARPGRMTPSILRTPTKRFYSKPSSSFTLDSASNMKKIFVTAGVASTAGLLWLTTTQEEIPRINCPPGEQIVTEPGPSKEQVTHILYKGACSYQSKNVPGVNRYDVNQLASNSPCEDRYIHGKLSSPWDDGKEWMAWAVFDGHAGWQTADLLTRKLLPFVRRSLHEVKSQSNEKSVPDELVQQAIMKAFVDLDDLIVKEALTTSQSGESLQDKIKKLAPAYAGSCALLSMYEPATSTLHVACTGDSRAVLGQQRPDGSWEAIPLSIDQSGRNDEEIARLYKEHPGEEDIVKDGRVLGIMVSRAFGDSRWKWSLDFQQEMKRRFNAPSPLTPRYDVRTPPYLTAEPVVTSTRIDPTKPSFLIMATDGLWDTLSSQQGVDLVGKWLSGDDGKRVKSPTYEPFDFGRFREGVDWRFVEERTTVQDDNAAVHLTRNSLGGNHHELIAGRLAFDSPFSRHLRDDITVQVVFFNKD